jgi:hypothetical protein
MGQRKGRAVSRGILLSAVAVGLATLAEPRGQKAGAQVLHAAQTSGELIPFLSECLQGNVHRSLLSDRHYKLSDKKRKPQPNPIRPRGEFSCRAPRSWRSFAKQYCISYNRYPFAHSLNRYIEYKAFTQVRGMLYADLGGPGCFPKAGKTSEWFVGSFYRICCMCRRSTPMYFGS